MTDQRVQGVSRLDLVPGEVAARRMIRPQEHRAFGILAAYGCAIRAELQPVCEVDLLMGQQFYVWCMFQLVASVSGKLKLHVKEIAQVTVCCGMGGSACQESVGVLFPRLPAG